MHTASNETRSTTLWLSTVFPTLYYRADIGTLKFMIDLVFFFLNTIYLVLPDYTERERKIHVVFEEIMTKKNKHIRTRIGTVK